jgi:hypothetical protein
MWKLSTLSAPCTRRARHGLELDYNAKLMVRADEAGFDLAFGAISPQALA